jgi:TRAP-type C4-dicarboxylate transport system permease large subunit
VFRARLGAQEILQVLVDTVTTTAMLFIVVIGALMFANFVNFTSFPQELLSFVGFFETTPLVVVIMICAIYVVLGSVMEELSMILLTLPLFFPVILALGYEPIWFGILIVCVVEIGMISPPVGMSLVVISTVIPQVSTSTVWRGVLPFFVADLLRLAILIAFPALSVWLPQLLF